MIIRCTSIDTPNSVDWFDNILFSQIYLGGVDTFNKNGLTARTNFDGCIDFVRFNGIKMISDAKAGGANSRFSTTGPVSFSCSVSHVCLVLTIINEGLIWHLSESSIRPVIDYTLIVKSHSNPFLEPTSTKQFRCLFFFSLGNTLPGDSCVSICTRVDLCSKMRVQACYMMLSLSN